MKRSVSGTNLARWQPERVEPNARFTARKELAVLEYKPLRTREEMEAAWAPFTASPHFLDFRIRKQFELRKEYVKEGGVVRHPLWIWQIGDAIVIAHGGEAYLEMARELRRRNPGRMILWLDMTNGPGYMYVATRRAYERNAYQAQQSLLAPGVFEELLEFVDRKIQELPR